jgi:hypothetical protein
MSKKKNTLKDLDAFLKQQAATLVSPEKLKTEDTPHLQESPILKANGIEITKEKILTDLKLLALKNQHQFPADLCDLIIQSLETKDRISGEDKMLINTALYLKHGQQWKDAIKDYWRNRK